MGMYRGFTLLELIVVIIIIGVLATLGVMQYQGAIEKSRGAEARQIMGQLRSACAAIYMGDNETENCTASALGLGNDGTGILIPNTTCAATHYFTYDVDDTGDGLDTITITATRCTEGGKSPQAATANTLTLTTDYGAGTDVWSTSGGY
jgi:prepilin-type N-terminal cleavage/methylation domain-containing protein